MDIKHSYTISETYKIWIDFNRIFFLSNIFVIKIDWKKNKCFIWIFSLFNKNKPIQFICTENILYIKLCVQWNLIWRKFNVKRTIQLTILIDLERMWINEYCSLSKKKETTNKIKWMKDLKEKNKQLLTIQTNKKKSMWKSLSWTYTLLLSDWLRFKSKRFHFDLRNF